MDVPFEACVAALYGCLPGPGGELPVGQSRLRGPIEHDPGSEGLPSRGALGR